MVTTSAETTRGTSALASRDAESSFEVAFEAHWSQVCKTLRRLVGDPGEAEDLALEVFYRLHRHPPREPRGLTAWLYRTATNVGLNALRARQRRRRYEEQAGALEMQRANSPDPAAEVERNEERRRVQQVLAQMKPRAARVLALRHSGLSYAEVAAALNVASSSVGTLLARAEKEFERRYRALEEGDEAP